MSYGLVKDRPYVVDGEVTVRPTCFLTMNFDRRVMAGGQAGRFFARVSELLTDPGWMIEHPNWRSFSTSSPEAEETQKTVVAQLPGAKVTST
jgi:hypothetical protein